MLIELLVTFNEFSNTQFKYSQQLVVIIPTASPHSWTNNHSHIMTKLVLESIKLRSIFYTKITL